MSESPVVALLGTGIMGAPMARNVLRAGMALRVYNRTLDKARPLAADGAEVCTEPVAAVKGADIVVTMLADGPALEAVMRQGGALEAMKPGALWIQMGTIGIEATERLSGFASRQGVAFVDAPVLGTKQPAEKGELLVLASGQPELEARCKPVFDAVGKKVLWVGDVGRASRLKLVINTWIVGLVGVLAETIAVANALGVEPERFLSAIDGGPIGPAYAQMKGRAMLSGSYAPSFPLKLALKDAHLVLEAAGREGLEAHIIGSVSRYLEHAVALGHGDQDMSAVYEAITG